MKEKDLPVYNIQTFNHEADTHFYANTLQEHLEKHHFIHVPHKHDFYLSILFTKGSGKHEVDFTMYSVKPGYVFMMSPGQTHNWKLSGDVEGYIFFHSKPFYDLEFTKERIGQFPFFNSIYNSPLITLKGVPLKKVTELFREILEEHTKQKQLKQLKILSLVNLVYIELTRVYIPGKTIENQIGSYLSKTRKLESLIDEHFKNLKYPKDYANLMSMTEKHLNRICKTMLNKTTTQLFTDRIILEAKRLLVQTDWSVNKVAETLGYDDNSYFSRLFKKHGGDTPLSFAIKYKH